MSFPSQNFTSLIAEKKWKFVFVFIVTFLVTFTALVVINLIPAEIQGSLPAVIQKEEKGENPVRIIIPKIGTDVRISNPVSRDIAVLDAALLQGAVHYPGSGLLGKGNMFLFGHSTSYSIVNNPAYKAFNNLKKLEVGDRIEVDSQSKRYWYSVRSVTLENADKALVDFTKTEKMLTLSTCNTFGAKQERYVVEADYVSSEALK